MTFKKRGSSLSAIVPGQGPLVYRACIEEFRQFLRMWFADVEMRAWKWANTYGEERPSCLYLTVGQTLTNEVFIAHLQEDGAECEITVKSDVALADALEFEPRFGSQVSHAKASRGFRQCLPVSDDPTRKYSIFLEVIKSSPMNFLSRGDKRQAALILGALK